MIEVQGFLPYLTGLPAHLANRHAGFLSTGCPILNVVFSEHGRGPVRPCLRPASVRRLQPLGIEGPGALGKVQDPILHVIR